jgi:hypothetical protein
MRGVMCFLLTATRAVIMWRVGALMLASALCLLCLPVGALACSGPGAREFIEENTRTAYVYAALGSVLFAATQALYFLRKRRGLAAVLFGGLMLAAHPAWTVSAMTGDCGISKASDAKVATGVLALMCSYQVFMWLLGLLQQGRT